eukprot:CAMPEP_0176235150 /NCGR_PEP_ID=MMETSP0121_2-20121125/26688_1 /TAXON_ID=160619 /ORGANISM="Kryptoperidinium foliaceum, Strain CCMP 1326" /LENGTH=395 /DNA_ID=CAMNT_0017574559 /DNA_START=78 /DNA_END=1262 /DNA_ORIENTATION=+
MKFLVLILSAARASALIVSRGSPPSNVTAATVAALHTKMEGVAAALEKMVGDGGQGSLSHAKVAPELRAFVNELKLTLHETESPKDPKAAFARLRAAQASMKDLTAALTAHQEELMHEGDAEEESLMLGVLMTRRGAPRDKQLEVIRSAEFRELAVSKALLAANDTSRPLFEQAAAYLDQHSSKTKAPSATAVDDKTGTLQKTMRYFSKRLDILEKEDERLKKTHEAAQAKFADMIKKSPADKARKMELVMKHSEHEFQEHMQKNQQQAKLLKDIVAALGRGDVEALKKAQAAMQKSLQTMKQQTGNFLHLLQLGHRLSSADCPYCAAQCIDKCQAPETRTPSASRSAQMLASEEAWSRQSSPGAGVAGQRHRWRSRTGERWGRCQQRPLTALTA